MKDDLQLLRSLHLRKIADIFDDEVKRADKAETSYQEFVARLMRAQWQANQEAALTWRIKRAGLPEQWTLETFPFKRQPGVNARQLRAFAELEFVDPLLGSVEEGQLGREATHGEGPFLARLSGSEGTVPTPHARPARGPAPRAELAATRALRLLRHHRKRGCPGPIPT
jgi:hypothetical protein